MVAERFIALLNRNQFYNYFFRVYNKFMKYNIKNINLASEGMKKINWTGKGMPVLAGIAKDFKKRKLFKKLPLAHVFM